MIKLVFQLDSKYSNPILKGIYYVSMTLESYMANWCNNVKMSSYFPIFVLVSVQFHGHIRRKVFNSTRYSCLLPFKKLFLCKLQVILTKHLVEKRLEGLLNLINGGVTPWPLEVDKKRNKNENPFCLHNCTMELLKSQRK